MSLSVIPYALGAAGLMNSADSARRNRNQAADAQRMAEDEAARRRRIQATVEEMVSGSGAYAESEGLRRGERNRERFERDSRQLQESTAGAFRIAGYKPGDTVTGDAITRVGRERSLKFDELVDNYIAQAKAERMQEAGAIASSAGITGPNQSYYQDVANMHRQQAANATAGVGGALTTLTDLMQPKAKPEVVQPPAQSGNQMPLAEFAVPKTDAYQGFKSLDVSDIFPKRKTNRFASPLFG